MMEMTENWGLRPQGADSGRAAVALAEQFRQAGNPFSLVLLDDVLPDTSGLEIAKHLQSELGAVGKIIMLLSSADPRQEQTRCAQLGLGAWLIKPPKQSDLLNSIVSAFGEHLAAHQPAPSRLREPAPSHLRRSILLAEDNPINQRVALGILGRRGHQLTIVDNGLKALDALAEQRFDLLLMDVEMPELDGLATAKEIRRREAGSGRHLPIVAMTAYAMKGDRERCLAAGMDEYLDKPLRPEKVFAVVESIALDGPPLLTSVAAQTPQDSRSIVFSGALAKVEASSTEANSARVDWKRALAEMHGDPLLMREIVGAYLDEETAMLERLAAAIAAADPAALRIAAHTLRGALLHFGAAAAVELAARLESMGRGQTFAGAPQAIEHLAQELGLVRSELENFLRETADETNLADPCRPHLI